jgi:tetratricopeptide (TPR) repeat protein
LKEHPGDSKYYKDIVKYYDQGLEQKITDKVLIATLLTNRAHVNILLGNYGFALQDARKCLQVDPMSVKAMYRIAKAANMLGRWKLSLQYAEKALKLDPKNKDLLKLKQQAEAGLVKQFEQKEKEKQIERRKKQIPKKLHEMLQSKGIKIGFSEMDSQHFNQLGVDEKLGIQIDPSTSELSFRVLFAYPEFNQTDCIQAFAESHTFRDHLDIMFPPNGPVFPFGDEKAQRNYVLPKLRLFYYDQTTQKKVHDKYVEFSMDSTLSEVLKEEQYYIPGSLLPVFYVIHDKSPYLQEWTTKK